VSYVVNAPLLRSLSRLSVCLSVRLSGALSKQRSFCSICYSTW